MEFTLNKLRATVQYFIAADSDESIDLAKQQLSRELTAVEALLRSPILRRPCDAAARCDIFWESSNDLTEFVCLSEFLCFAGSVFSLKGSVLSS